jgi:hypothetical protein
LAPSYVLESFGSIAVHENECVLKILRISDNKLLGKIRTAYSAPEISRIDTDLIALSSADWYGDAHSLQIFDFPSLNPGPWFVTDDESTPDDDESIDRNALVPFSGSTSFEVNGKFLIVRKGDTDTAILAVPPWGKRLRELLITGKEIGDAPWPLHEFLSKACCGPTEH